MEWIQREPVAELLVLGIKHPLCKGAAMESRECGFSRFSRVVMGARYGLRGVCGLFIVVGSGLAWILAAEVVLLVRWQTADTDMT